MLGPQNGTLQSQCPPRPTDRTQLPGVQVGREMSDLQAHLRISWKTHQWGKHQSFPDNFCHQRNWHCSTFGESLKFMETEKSYSILSFNWKEENLLKKKLSFLEAMKKSEANAWLMEQKAFYKRCHSKLQRSELAHARLLGNKDLVKQLTNKDMFSNYTNILMDESEAAVKAIVQNRRDWEKNKILFRLSFNKDRPHPALRSDFLKSVETQAASRVSLTSDSKEESLRTTVKIRRSPSGREGKSNLILSAESLNIPEQEAQQTKPVDSSPPWKGKGAIRDFSSKPSSILHNNLQDPDSGWKAKGKLLKYIVYGDRCEEHSKKKRPKPRNDLTSDLKTGPVLREKMLSSSIKM